MIPKMRDDYARSYKPILQRNIQEVVTAEVRAVRQAIENDGSLLPIYQETIPWYLRARVRPVQFGFGKDIIHATKVETGLDLDPMDGVFVAFYGAYSDTFDKRYIGSHLGQLHALASTDEVLNRLEEWLEKEAAKRSLDESVRQNQATFREGVFSRNKTITWHIRGSDTCPYCRRLNGKKISKSNPFFVPKMGSIDPGVKGKKPMVTYTGIGHPPAHRGCDCFTTI